MRGAELKSGEAAETSGFRLALIKRVERQRRFLAAARIRAGCAARRRAAARCLALRGAGRARLGAATGARLDHRAVRFEGGEGIVLASGIAHVVSCNSVAGVERVALRGTVAGMS